MPRRRPVVVESVAPVGDVPPEIVVGAVVGVWGPDLLSAQRREPPVVGSGRPRRASTAPRPTGSARLADPLRARTPWPGCAGLDFRLLARRRASSPPDRENLHERAPRGGPHGYLQRGQRQRARSNHEKKRLDMVRSGNAQAQRPLAAATTALAVTATLLLLAGPAVAGKPTTQSLLVGATAPSTACSVKFDVTNPNSSGQTIEIGAMDTLSKEKVYSTTRIGGGEIKEVSVSVPGSATYVGFAANSAGRTYSDKAATVTC